MARLKVVLRPLTCRHGQANAQTERDEKLVSEFVSTTMDSASIDQTCPAELNSFLHSEVVIISRAILSLHRMFDSAAPP
jgi:hypothetical protein